MAAMVLYPAVSGGDNQLIVVPVVIIVPVIVIHGNGPPPGIQAILGIPENLDILRPGII